MYSCSFSREQKVNNQEVTMYKTLLNESDLYPTSLRPYGSIAHMTMHSNADIERWVLGRAKLNPATSSVYAKIEEGLATRAIIVGYEDPSVLRFFFRKFARTIGITNEGHIMGFYNPYYDRIVVLLDNNVNIWGDKEIWHDLLNILLHELIHMGVQHNPQLFLKDANTYLIDYYSRLVKSVLAYYKIERNVSATSVRSLVKDLTYARVKNITSEMSTREQVAIWTRFFKTFNLPQDTKNEVAYFILGPLFHMNEDDQSVLGASELIKMTSILHDAYKAFRIQSAEVSVGQEASIPDEVIGVLAIHNIGVSSTSECINKIKFTDFRERANEKK